MSTSISLVLQDGQLRKLAIFIVRFRHAVKVSTAHEVIEDHPTRRAAQTEQPSLRHVQTEG
jgi:hypothetical protein